MNDEFLIALSWSKSNQKKISKTLKKISSRKDTDQVINHLHEKVFEEVDCLSCANCCKTTGPLLRSADIKKISRHLKMAESRFTDEYLRTDEDGDFVFKSMPCPFLMEDNYCGIYEHRPKACRQFPHTDQSGQVELFNLTRKNAKICPAVSKILQALSEIG